MSYGRKGLKRIKACSIYVRLQLLQFEVIHWLHFSKTKLNRIFPFVSTTCDKCKSADGPLWHLFCSCSKLTSFWVDSFHLYIAVCNRQLAADGLLVILGCSNDSLVIPSVLQQALWFGVVIAKQLIPREWKSASPPCFKKGWMTWVLVYILFIH